MYITPARVATLGLGFDVSDVPAADLRAACLRATATVNAVCAVPRLPKAHDFRGGVIVAERHEWVIDTEGRPHPNRVYLNHEPVVSVERLRIYSTNTQYIEIDPAEIVINQSGGWIEISSLLLTQYGIFGAGIIPYIGLYNPVVEVNYTYRYQYVVVDEVADQVDARTFQCASQFWLPSATVVVKVDGDEKTIDTDYTLDKTEGQVIFTANQDPSVLVEVSYTYTLPDEIRDATQLLLAEDLGEKEVRASGLAGLEALRVSQGGGATIEKTKPQKRRGSGPITSFMDQLPVPVQALLSGYVYVSAR